MLSALFLLAVLLLVLVNGFFVAAHFDLGNTFYIDRDTIFSDHCGV